MESSVESVTTPARATSQCFTVALIITTVKHSITNTNCKEDGGGGLGSKTTDKHYAYIYIYDVSKLAIHSKIKNIT